MFKREFKINIKSLMIWVVVLLSLYIMIFAMYPSLVNEETQASLMEMMNSMPSEILASFNMDIVGIDSAYGWFKTEGYTFLVLTGALYSAILGSTILLKEESDKTIEFLLSKPISRNNIVTSRIITGVFNILIFTFIVTIGNLIALNISGSLDISEFLLISLSPILLYFMMFFISLFMSLFFKKSKKSLSFAICLVFAFYIMQIVGGLGGSLSFLKDISLFEFVSSRYIILNNTINYTYLFVGIGIIILMMFFTYKIYNKKEFK